MATGGFAALRGIPLSSCADQANRSYNSDQEEQDVEYPESDDESRFRLVTRSPQCGRGAPGSNAEVNGDGATNDTDKQHSHETYPEAIPDPLDDLPD